MEYCKMIFRVALWLSLSRVLYCYPSPQNPKLPALEVSSPEEVNSLEQDEPIHPQNPKNKIEDTVKEVEEIIKSDPKLPRLTRGEILDLLENITSVDQLKPRDPKAIMVVMPFTPTNDKNMEDLYTKAPITHMIGGEPFKAKDERKHTRRRPPVKFNDADNDVAKRPPEEKKKFSVAAPARRRPEASTERAVTLPTTNHPTQTVPTTYHPRARRPVRRRPTTQHPNHRYTDFAPSDGIRIVQSPVLNPRVNQSSDLDHQENVKQEVVMTTTIKPVIQEINFPDNLKTVVKDLNLEAAMNPKATTKKPSPLDEQERIKNMLASLGILTETTTTTTTPTPNAESVADSLSPEMRDLLMTFGLLPNPNQKPSPAISVQYNPEKAEVKPEFYSGFKPLPEDGPSRDDMDALLASFGLGRSARKGKAVNLKESPEKADSKRLNFDMVPDDLKGVLTDLGIAKKSQKIEPAVQQQHVFNPDTQQATDEELKKLGQLLEVIKQLERINGTADEDLKNIDLDNLKELVGSLNSEPLETLDHKGNSPNPNNFDFGVSKNEVKRQESTTTSTTTEEAKSPSIVDLEASFGGQTETVTEAAIPETTTKRTGFYYLVDWNTFLDIDDMKGKHVNLRFQPTVGDPKRFLSVNVP